MRRNVILIFEASRRIVSFRFIRPIGIYRISVFSRSVTSARRGLRKGVEEQNSMIGLGGNVVVA